MEGVSDQLPSQQGQPAPEKLRPSTARFDAANDFLTSVIACQPVTTVATIGKMYNGHYALPLALTRPEKC